MEELKQNILSGTVPRHIAIIMDGNGRWAQQRGKMRIFGHKNALTAVRESVEGAAEIGVEYLTLYAFSTENWNRPKNEVDALMDLLVQAIRKEVPKLNENGIKLEAIGDIASLPAKSQKALSKAIQLTSHNDKMTLVLALSYSSRWEITQAVKQISEKVQEGKLTLAEINEQVVSQHLCTKNYPDPELMIRTSGEQRISNFLLWQIAYAELYFTPILWPDFRKKDLFEAVQDFQRRERRFGKTSEQVKVEQGK
jgi:undecaprenyl diphosphate synthase